MRRNVKQNKFFNSNLNFVVTLISVIFLVIVLNLFPPEKSSAVSAIGSLFSGLGTIVLSFLALFKGSDIVRDFRLSEGSKLKYEAIRRATRFVELTNSAFSNTRVSEGEIAPDQTYYQVVMNRLRDQEDLVKGFIDIWIDVECFFGEEKTQPYFRKIFDIFSNRKSALESWMILKDSANSEALEHWNKAVCEESNAKMNEALGELKSAIGKL